MHPQQPFTLRIFLFPFRLHWAFTCTSYPGGSWSPFLTETERIEAKGPRGANPPSPSPRSAVAAQERTAVCIPADRRLWGGSEPGPSLPGGADGAQERRRCCPRPPGRAGTSPGGSSRGFPGAGSANSHSRGPGGRAGSRHRSPAALRPGRSPQSRSPGPHGPPPPRPGEDVTPRGRPWRARL